MKSLLYLILAMLLGTAAARAQWMTRSYNLADGWNGIWLAGDASYTTVDELLEGIPAVTEVWRWNPNPDETAFISNPNEPRTSSEEWTVWKRNDPGERRLKRLLPNSSYLIRTTSAVNLSIKQLAVPPSNTWLISGANFMGFPSKSDPAPTFNSYLSSYQSAQTNVLAPTTKIYKYVGGALGPNNPVPILPTEKLESNRAYWFKVATVGNFTGPLEYEVASSEGLAFGRTGVMTVVGVKNRSSRQMLVKMNLLESESAPAFQPTVSGGVPIKIRYLNPTTGLHEELDPGSNQWIIAPNGRRDLTFTIDRSRVSGDADAYYASVLKFTDDANLSEVFIPVSAKPSTKAGLWMIETTVNAVDRIGSTPIARNQDPSSGGSTTPRAFELQFLAHMDSSGMPRLLSRAYVGKLAAAGNPMGITVDERKILSARAQVSDPQSALNPKRYFSPQMPTDALNVNGTGAFGAGKKTVWSISIPWNDPTNPFVHTYHPDHDNKSPAGRELKNGQESFSINRTCEFTFTEQSPDGRTVVGWDTFILGGTYRETIKGLHSQAMTVSGTFKMRRISEIGTIDVTPAQ